MPSSVNNDSPAFYCRRPIKGGNWVTSYKLMRFLILINYSYAPLNPVPDNPF